MCGGVCVLAHATVICSCTRVCYIFFFFFFCVLCFFFNDTATTEIYTLSLHDALPIYGIALPPNPEDLILGARGAESNLNGIGALPASSQICSCENVCKGNIEEAIKSGNLENLGDRKSTRLNSSHVKRSRMPSSA